MSATYISPLNDATLVNGVSSEDTATALMPDPEWVRGTCPDCGGPVVSNLYYVGGKGYITRWECWHSLGQGATCNFRKVL